MGEKLYKVAYKFNEQVVFTIEFKGEEDLSSEELDGILLEQAAIMRGADRNNKREDRLEREEENDEADYYGNRKDGLLQAYLSIHSWHL